MYFHVVSIIHMKTKNILLAVAAFAAFTSVQAGTVEPVTVTAEESSTPSIVVETGYSSESVWRGADLGRDEASAVVTTTTELPIGVGLDLVAGYSNADTEVKDEETDLSAVFSKEIADYLVSLSYTWYSQDFAKDGSGQAQEAGLSVSREVGPVDVTFTQYLAVKGDNNSYSELAATYSDDFGLPVVLDFRSELGYLAQEGKCTHFETRISTDIPVLQEVTAVPFVAYSLGLDDSVGVHSDMQSVFFGGIEFKRSF